MRDSWARRSPRRSAVIVALLLLLPATAHANAGVPMLAFVWPGFWLAFIPIVLIEALVARRVLGLALSDGLRVSLSANLWSTALGIPLTWLALLLPEMGAGYAVASLELEATGPGWYLLAPLMAPWLGPGATSWQVYAAAAWLCIPFCLMSMWIEGWAASRRLSREHARKWARAANLVTYGPATAALVLLALTEKLSP
jgi:hypothetical protein